MTARPMTLARQNGAEANICPYDHDMSWIGWVNKSQLFQRPKNPRYNPNEVM